MAGSHLMIKFQVPASSGDRILISSPLAVWSQGSAAATCGRGGIPGGPAAPGRPAAGPGGRCRRRRASVSASSSAWPPTYPPAGARSTPFGIPPYGVSYRGYLLSPGGMPTPLFAWACLAPGQKHAQQTACWAYHPCNSRRTYPRRDCRDLLNKGQGGDGRGSLKSRPGRLPSCIRRPAMP